MSSLYETDFHAWANEQVALLRDGRLSEADVDNIIEEIDSMGRSEKRELVNRLVVLLLHLLKWRFQPGLRGNSWRLSIKEQRLRLESHLADNPSLKSKLDESIGRAYRLAMIEAERETGLPESTFPSECPFSFEHIMDEGFWPEDS
ncbi:DUF29 domain-containing protein [Imhoffiella purpurea]|uniref:Beta-glucosidase n=1 Tax=Imhoffiella purpurea TaxID=1249627 RepID=W9V5W3_9GAMM|nr:DUF29 domain-containing protein [Imhoffiella purpurea]EXJ14923.1 Beta-glucosidase [Imhoffiella purpurea]